MRLNAIPMLLILALSQVVNAADAPWITLFDGKSLNGWKAAENPKAFTVVDGTLKVNGTRGHLFYEGRTFKNFEFQAEVKTARGANSGIFFHTKFQSGGWPGQGYEAQVNATHGDSIKTGSLYGVVKVNPAPHNDDEWFKYKIVVAGKRIVVTINDKIVVDYAEKNPSGTRKLSSGTFAIQAHDPKSVVHFRNIRARPLPEDATADAAGAAKPAETNRAAIVAARSGRWWQKMDYGPFHSSTVGIKATGTTVLKGITIELTPDRKASVTFDTEMLNMVAGYRGYVRPSGTTYDGRHGGFPTANAALEFGNKGGPGWANAGSFQDPRDIPHGPLPAQWAKYRGLFRHGDRVVLSYSVGSAGILEMPSLETHQGIEAITRTLQFTKPSKALTLHVADGSGMTVSAGRQFAGAAPQAPAASKPNNAVQHIADRTDGDWSTLPTGAPSKTDYADASAGNNVEVRWVKGFAAAHSLAGANGQRLPRANDGAAAASDDDVKQSTWLDGGAGRMVMDLKKPVDLSRISTYSWHKSDRAPQKYTLWGTAQATAAENAKNPATAGWTQLATVDTRPAGEGGKHGTALTHESGSIGRYQKLMWTFASAAQGTFISEIDVFAVGQTKPALGKSRNITPSGAPGIALIGAPKGVQLSKDAQGRILLSIPAGTAPGRLKIVHGRGDKFKTAIADWPTPANLIGFTRGGRKLWPQTITVQGKLGKSDGPYASDEIPIPFENPWSSYMRVGGFDFFSDGTTAAICTWNGDVWLVSGIDKKLEKITWKRYASGLFETLGLKIVDDKVYVHGKDQITKLHDLNKDGEADYYQNFNNEYTITKNFHEFPFDLHTDKAGTFYFAKAGPVRSGGRGFEKIVPHQGTIMTVDKNGKNLQIYSTGLRAPNGIGVGPDGQVTSSDNEGTWVPQCKIHWCSKGSFQGVVDLAPAGTKPTTFNPPLCYLPKNIDNSGGGQAWVTDDRWGPFNGQLLHCSYGRSSIYVVMKEKADGQIQGGVFRLPVNLTSSAMRARFNAADGQLYVCGLKGWQTNAARLAGFHRIRYTGKPVHMPKAMRVTDKGVYVSFTSKLDKESAEDDEGYAIKIWNYKWTSAYGSPHFSPRTGKRGEDKLEVKSAKLQADGKTVFLEIPGIKPVMQMHIRLDVKSTDGHRIRQDIYNTINKLGK